MGKKKPRRIAGRYDVLRSLGEGTTGTTFLVTDTSNGATVVLKVPREDLSQEVDLVRFQRAYAAMSQIDHPGIVRILEVGPSYLTVAYVPGDSIASLAGEPVHHVLDGAIELAEILAAMHQHGLIHRRIHPGNVRLDADGRLVLLDFGFPLGRGLEPGLTAGESPAADYMAPEVLRGFEVDPRADIYSVGVLVYELLTGKRPPASRALAVPGAPGEAEVVPPSRINKDVPPGFERILLSAMALDPVDRFQSAEELLNELIFLSGKSEIARIRTEKGRRFLLPPRFVGHDALLSEIDEAWAVAQAGHSRALFVHGARGLGKSRLLREARARCMGAGAILLDVDCEEAADGPIAPAVGLVRQLLVLMEKRRPHRIGDAAGRWGGLLAARIPDLARKSYLQSIPPAVAIPDPDASRELLELLLALVEKDALVLLLDNLHAAHELFGRFVYDLLARGRNDRVLVVATRRVGDEESEGGAVSRLLPRLRSEGLVAEYPLEPLSSDELASFVGSMVGRKRLDGLLVERIEEVTSGVPRLAEETMGTLADEGLLFRRGGVWQIEIDDTRRIQRPRLVEDRVIGRLDELDDRERRILTIACVLGDRVDPVALAELTGVAGRALDAALERLAEIGFLERAPGLEEAVYGVAGRETRRKLLAEIDRNDLARLHGEAAAWLEGAGRDKSDEDLEAIAHHHENSSDPAKAIRWLVKAGDRARRTVAVDRAIALFERALALAGEDSADGADILGKLGSVYSRAGRFDQAVAHYTKALQAGKGDTRGAAFFLMGLGYAYSRKNKHTDALHCFNQLLTAFGDDGVRPEVLTHISRTWLAKGNLKKSEEVCLEALEQAKSLERGRVEAAIRNQLGEIRWVQGRWTESLECQSAALDLLPDDGEYFLKSRIAYGMARIHLGRGDRERCYKYLEDALYEAQTCGDQVFATEVQNHIGEIFERAGELDRAQEIFFESTKTAERLDQQPVVALGCLNQGRLLVKRGRTVEAVDYLTRARRLFRDCRLPWGVGASYLHLGEAFVLDKRNEKAKTSFALAERSLRDVQMKWMLGYVYCGVAEVFVSEQQFDTALKMLNKALGQAKEYQDPALLGRAHREYAAFCLATERRDVAVEHFVRSQMVLDEVGAKFELAKTHLEYGRYLLGSERTGDRGNLKSAVNHLRKSRDLLSSAGETVWSERVAAALKECERERINVHRRDDLTQAARDLLAEIAALEAKAASLAEEISAGLAEQGKRMDAAGIRDEVEKRLAKHVKDLRAKQEKILREIEDLREERNSLWSLQQVAGEMNAVHDSGQVFGMTTGMMIRVIRAERGALLLKGEGGRVQFQGGQGLTKEEFDGPAFENVRAVAAKVIASGEATLTRDGSGAGALPEGKAPDPSVVRSTLCVPLAIRENPIGALFAQGAAGGPRFADRDLDLFAGFAKQVAVALENAFLYEELNAKQKLEQELNLAHRIQAKLLPKTIPQVPGVEVYGRMIPAGKVGGDYYDFITDDKARNLILCIGDVSGKGMPGGLVMVMARVLLHYFDVADQSTRDTLLRANEILKANTEPFMFMSMLLLKWESEAKRLTYTGAGHENLLIFRSREEEVEVVPAGGVVLGIKDDISGYLTEKEIGLDPGDAILLYTDGCTEAQNPRGEMFELENLTRSFSRHAARDVAEVCDGVIADLKKFMGTAEQHDDITVTVLKRAL